MGWISVAICVVAAYRTYVTGAGSIFVVALGVAIANFWSFGVMHNYQDDPSSAPNYASTINMITTLAGIALLIYSFFR